MIKKKILVVDDEPDIRNLIKEILEDENFEVLAVENAAKANETYIQFQPNLVLLDIWMPDTDGISLLRQWNKANQINIPIIMISGHGTIETAVEATRLGAYDFIEKPLSLAKLILTVNNALEHISLKNENQRLKKYTQNIITPIGKSEVMQNLRDRIAQIAEHNAPVFISGESGTGKELFARYLHTKSSRSNKAFVNIRIDTLTPGNHLKDFFGNQTKDTEPPGYFEQAEGGTLLLQEIANMEPILQAQLQDNLKTQCFMQEGSNQKKAFNIRIISASNHNILNFIQEGSFRDDLYHQLNILPMHIPPLREHTEDIPELLEYYVNFFVERENLPYRHFTVATQNYLRNYAWPGNIRELKNLVQKLLILGNGKDIHKEEVEIGQNKLLFSFYDQVFTANFDLPLRQAREQFEKQYLQYRLNLSGGNVSKTAEAVGMERTHLYRKLKSLNIKTGNQNLK